MPVMEADAAKRYLAETGGKDPIPIVALRPTPPWIQGRRARMPASGPYITKPFETRKVLNVLNTLTAQHAASHASNIGGPIVTERGTKEVRPGLDEATLEEIESMGPTKDFVKNLVWIFIRDSEKRIREMESAAEAKNAKSFCDAAHALKGMAGSIGALAAMDICDRLQRMQGKETTYERLAAVGDLKEEITW